MTPKKLKWRLIPDMDILQWEGRIEDHCVITISQYANDCFTTKWIMGYIELDENDYRSLNAAKRAAQLIWERFVYSLLHD